MCGIVAMQGPGADEARVREMLAPLRHRGPDGEGVLRLGDTVLGHARLAILDVAGGAQPMAAPDGTGALAFNGEIYNHAALRRGLGPGPAFRTRTDTEVLLRLLQARGADALPALDGMYAFAWAGPGGLLVARDPLGIKPVYCGRTGDTFVVASEMRALPPLDDAFLLPAGHAWTPGRAPWRHAAAVQREPVLDLPREQAVARLRTLLEAAVVKRLMADVPVGVFLSGGLDSSVVAALMRRHVPVLHSFAAGMPGSPDLDAARRVAAVLGTVHHEAVYTGAEALEALPRVVASLESFDAPLVRSAVPGWFVSRLAARHVKVVLTGEGADELLAGYRYLRGLAGDDALRAELSGLLDRLQDTNLQRTDRTTMAHGLEGRVPFLDLDLVRFLARLPPSMLAPEAGGPEKRLLRDAFRDLLPADIADRPKAKFSEGTGTDRALSAEASRRVARGDFERRREVAPGLAVRSPEELWYHDLWRQALGPRADPRLVGRTRDPAAGAEGWDG